MRMVGVTDTELSEFCAKFYRDCTEESEAREKLEFEILERADKEGRCVMYSPEPPYEEIEFDPDSDECPVVIDHVTLMIIGGAKIAAAFRKLSPEGRKRVMDKAWKERDERNRRRLLARQTPTVPPCRDGEF